MATLALRAQHATSGPANIPFATSSSMASEQVAQARPNHDGNAISEAHPGHSLFDASETRFLTDSLSSADTFDPFTIGAPGFKVPSVLPPNLGGMGAPPRGANPNGGSYQASMPTSATAGPSNYYTMPSASAQASSSQPRASMGLAGQNWEKSAHRPSLFDPQWLNATAAANGGNSSAERSSFSSAGQSMGMASGGEGSKAGEGSGSGSNTPVGSGQRGAYGKDRAWQLEQLEALQAERDKYLAHARSGSASQAHTPQISRHPIYQLNAGQQAPYAGDGSDGVPDYPPGPHGQAYAAALAKYGVQPPSHFGATASAPGGYVPQASGPSHPAGPHFQPAPGGASFVGGQAHSYNAPPGSQHMWPQRSGSDSGRQPSNLGMLGLSFPSTHSFPAAPGQAAPASAQHFHPSEQGAQSWQSGTPNRSTSLHRAGAGAAVSTHALPGSKSNEIAESAGGQPRGRSSEVKGSQREAQSSDSFAKRAQAFLESSPSRAAPPAPMPPPVSIDVQKGLESIPSTLRATFHSTPFEKLQPHLEMLREQRRAGLLKKCDSKRPGGSAEVDADEEGGPSKASSSAAASAAKKEKGAPHVLLTDAEKKANHIASEQKRRANIRKGYEMLCDLVPNLREALGAEASAAAAAEKSRDGSSMDTDPSPAPAASKKKEGWEVGGEKIDGRAGPRSEAIVLHETVEYVRQRLEEHQALVIRQQAARKAVAARYGADISIAISQTRSEQPAAPKSKSKKAKS
ncbi:hypothetical protein IE81DRAFT_349274 [Ceraceosorus guamensis]|uniref:BHLH domain-containing protein n=1 Tax=Ceraceosorus guamensis TaxID=1522189 RepID=A0A316VSR9_9BASI|nr:hypothetical protein IE81DRAFT_349274 [Ceraceosorus guamensis]PWN40420.1 hypothetical protein IE81DRAFT_349274 [Ceraceosorus guamensis]